MSNNDGERVVRRGDSFDQDGQDGGEASIIEYPGGGDISNILQNPDALIKSLDLTPEQAKNVRSIIVGSGTGLAYKALSGYVGGEIAGAIGGFLSAYVSKKITGGD